MIFLSSGVSKDASDRPGRTVLAELGSCQLEYKYLSHVTGKQDYFQKASVMFLQFSCF